MSEPTAIPVACPSCDRAFRVRPAAAGRNVKCPGCGEAVAVPMQEASPPQLPVFANGPSEASNSQPDDPFADLGQFQAEAPPAVNRWNAASASSPYQPPNTLSQSEPTANFQIRSSNFTPRQYPALQIIRIILRVLASLLIAICLIALAIFCFAFLMKIGNVEASGAVGIIGGGITGFLFGSLPVLFTSLILFSYAELISVFLDVQRNTQESAYHLRLKS
jgi:hypothetical protein